MNHPSLDHSTIEPVSVDADAVAYVSESPSLPFRFARSWARYAPRAKGWMPRKVRGACANRFRDVVRTAAGAKLVVEPATLDTYCAIYASGGRWEWHVLEGCARLIRPGESFYDIGANVGIMSMEIAQRLRGDIDIFAFEPQPKLARAVAASARLNGFNRVRVYQTMLGEAVGTADLYVPSHSIHASAISREAGAEVVPCSILTLDGLIAAGRLRPPTLIKIDVEGAELMVFKGTTRTLAEHRPTIVFESDENASRFGYTRRQLCDLLSTNGRYRFYELSERGVSPADHRIDADDSANLIAVPAERSLTPDGRWVE